MSLSIAQRSKLLFVLGVNFSKKASFNLPFQSWIIPPPLDPKLPQQEPWTLSFRDSSRGFSHITCRGLMILVVVVVIRSSSSISLISVLVLSLIPSTTTPRQCCIDSQILSPLSNLSFVLALHLHNHNLHEIIVGRKSIIHSIVVACLASLNHWF